MSASFPTASGAAFPMARGYMSADPFCSFGMARLPTDPIGTATVTFVGVNANSEIRVYLPSGAEAAGVETCSANPVLAWPVYSPGSANNTVTIRIVHPSYKIKEFNYTASVGVVSLPVQQEIDKWYSNP